jgi:hypothetical protein
MLVVNPGINQRKRMSTAKSAPRKSKQTQAAPTAAAPATPTPPAPKVEVPLLDKDGNPLFGLLTEYAKGNNAELFRHGKEIHKLHGNVEKAETALNGCKKFAGKFMAAMQVAYIIALNSKTIAPDTKFEKYYEDNVGHAPIGRIQTLGRVFNRLVEMGHITEAIYDAQPLEALEKANETFSALEKKYKGTGTDIKTTAEFKAMVNALHGKDAAGNPFIGTDATKAIKAIKAGLKGTTEKSDETKGKESESDLLRISQLTPEIALQLWSRIVAQGHAPVCLVQFPTELMTLDTEAQKSALEALNTAHGRTFELRKALLAGQQVQKSAGGVAVLNAGTPALEKAAA